MTKTTKGPRPYLNPYVGGFLLGLVLFAAFFVTGNGLGASGALTRLGVQAAKTAAPAHVDQTAYLARLGGGDLTPLEHSSLFMLLGVFVGGILSGVIGRRFRPELRKGSRISNGARLAFALLGGAIMGYGARLARGCTSGQGLSGAAVLSVGSLAFLFSIFIGGYALAWFVRRLWT